MRHFIKVCASAGACMALFFMAAADARAQAPKVLSPEVHPDRKVTFRLPLANAKSVVVKSDFTAKDLVMAKDDKGVWSVTTEPLKPNSYQYWFVVDGFTMPDPSNTHVRNASGVFKSQVEVPGDEAAWSAVRDVPHGTLHEHWYNSKQNGTLRRVVIYTPPGYPESGKKLYPVLYLLHGKDDFERGWTQGGRAHWIMDNLIADGKAVPALIVMPFTHGLNPSTGKLPEAQAIQAAQGFKPAPTVGFASMDSEINFMEKDLLTQIIPMVEKEYSVARDAGHRAIAGYSMGASQSLAIGFGHPELFSHIGAFSFPSSGEQKYAAALNNPEKTNKDYKVIWLGCGGDDGVIGSGRAFDKLLTTKGIRHQWTETPGYRHDYTIWRIYLRDMAPLLFRD